MKYLDPHMSKHSWKVCTLGTLMKNSQLVQTYAQDYSTGTNLTWQSQQVLPWWQFNGCSVTRPFLSAEGVACKTKLPPWCTAVCGMDSKFYRWAFTCPWDQLPPDQNFPWTTRLLPNMVRQARFIVSHQPLSQFVCERSLFFFRFQQTLYRTGKLWHFDH